MKIQIASDIHTEFMKPGQLERFVEKMGDTADVLVLAGDIAPLRFMDQIRDTFKPFCDNFKHVVYVPGNHEFYKTSIKDGAWLLNGVAQELHNFHPLWNREIEIDGQKFYGGTMWFQKLPGNDVFKEMMNDFFLIKDFEPTVYEENKHFKYSYDRLVTPEHIVVTHHLPHYMSVPARFSDVIPGVPSMNRFFVNEMGETLRTKHPKLWIHGHTHDACDYNVGATRIVCNPYGYPSEGQRNKFNSNLIIEV
jgi:Icc-related predicted phosphoesterase